MSGGFTVDPAVYQDEFGVEHIDYNDAVIRQTHQGQHRFDYDDYVIDRETHEYRHQYADIDGDELERRLDNDNGYYNDPDSQYAEGLKELAGGAGNYQQMISWAAQALDEETIDWFDSQIDTDDPQAMEEAVLWLIEQYQENVDTEPEQDDSQLFYDDGTIDVDLRDRILDNTVGGAQNYLNLVSWAAEALPEHMIDQYDSIMESGVTEDIVAAIERLSEMYYESN